MTYDAVIVGSGPGGSAAADVLSAAGWSIALVEKGRNHLIDPQDPSRLATDFSNDEIKFTARHFLGPDPFLEPRTFRCSEADGDHTHVGEVNSVPSTVGGGGTHADGKVPRFRDEDFALLSTYGPIDGAEVADWPISYDDLEPFYAEAEKVVGVAGDAGANPFGPWRSGPYPMPPGAPMYGALVSSRACEEEGLHPYPAPTAANSIPYGGRQACNNCGFCSFFGCPIHAKGDPVAMLQRALGTGNVELIPETFVSRVIFGPCAAGSGPSSQVASGVEVIGPDGSRRVLSARNVIVAGGAIETPRLLLLSGVQHPLLGRHLMVHFQTYVAGEMNEDMHMDRGRSVTHVHDDHVIVDDAARAAARDAGLGWIRGGMVEHAGPALPILEAKMYPWGSAGKAQMISSPLRRHLFAFCMQGEDLPQITNRVDLDPKIRDVRGFPVARITYEPHRHELVASAHHAKPLVRALERMGAKWSAVTTSPATAEVAAIGLGSSVPESRHLMGTARMGHDPKTSVTDPWGRVHGYENVFVADSSVFVTSAGYGPTLTLVALAMRLAKALAG